MDEIQKRIEQVRVFREIQAESADYDEYMHGMYNGIEFTLSLLENRDPEYREAPSVWGYETKGSDQPIWEPK